MSRVHGDKILRRRDGICDLKHYQDARSILEEDFFYLCGYCGKNGKVMHQKFHIDHFVPKSLDWTREHDYYNLVLACSKCNLSKSNKWPTKDKDVPYDDNQGFVDPASEEYDKHMERDEEGFVRGITLIGESMCDMLHLDIRRTDLFWKVEKIGEVLNALEKLYVEKKLSEKEKDFYIEANMKLKSYIDAVFDKGE